MRVCVFTSLTLIGAPHARTPVVLILTGIGKEAFRRHGLRWPEKNLSIGRHQQIREYRSGVLFITKSICPTYLPLDFSRRNSRDFRSSAAWSCEVGSSVRGAQVSRARRENSLF